MNSCHRCVFLLCLLAGLAFAGLPNVAVLDITGNFKDFSREDLSAIAGRFETELSKTGKMQILERRSMDLILQEQGFQQSGACNSSECQVQMGQLLGVEYIVAGSLVRFGRKYALRADYIDVGTGKVNSRSGRPAASRQAANAAARHSFTLPSGQSLARSAI